MKIKSFILFSISMISLLLFSACSSSEETTSSNENDDGDEVYVFDAIPENNANEEKGNTANEMKYVYFIQIGAFASKLNAEGFTEKSELKLGEKLDVTFNDQDNLYVVRYRRIFNSRDEAEKIRNELWQTEDFRDAW
ncbi:MAG: SPOR domain-containing protein, partial [Ignavibacteriaceae bacterium]